MKNGKKSLEDQIGFVNELKCGQIYPLGTNGTLLLSMTNDFRRCGLNLCYIYTDLTKVNKYYFESLGGGWIRYRGNDIRFPPESLSL